MECNERTRKFNRGRRTWDRTFAEILTWRTFVITFTPIIFFLYLRIFLVSSLKLKFSKLNTACCHQLRDFLTWSQLLVVGCSFNEHWGPKRPMGRDGTVGRYSYLSHPPHIFCRVEKKKKTEPTPTNRKCETVQREDDAMYQQGNIWAYDNCCHLRAARELLVVISWYQ